MPHATTQAFGKTLCSASTVPTSSPPLGSHLNGAWASVSPFQCLDGLMSNATEPVPPMTPTFEPSSMPSGARAHRSEQPGLNGLQPLKKVALITTAIEQLQSLDATVSHLADLGELNRVQRRLFSIEIASQEAAHAEAQLEAIEATTALLGILGLAPTAVDLLRPAFPTTDNVSHLRTAPPASLHRIRNLLSTLLTTALLKKRFALKFKSNSPTLSSDRDTAPNSMITA